MWTKGRYILNEILTGMWNSLQAAGFVTGELHAAGPRAAGIKAAGTGPRAAGIKAEGVQAAGLKTAGLKAAELVDTGVVVFGFKGMVSVEGKNDSFSTGNSLGTAETVNCDQL